MAHDSASNNSNSGGSSWTEPPWQGWIETTGDALLILEAARRGLIPRVTRRLVDSERKMITSGSVFVFDEDESGIKRWTDGFFWSPSRILGNFLLYRETEKRGAGHRSARAEQTQGPPEAAEGAAQYNMEGVKLEGQTLSRPKGESSRLGIDRQRERVLVGSLTNSYKFKPGGMMKKTFSLTIGGVAQHLISYYKVEDVEQGRLRAPSTLPELSSLAISPEYLDKTHFRNPPKVEIGVDGIPRYRGEADDIDTSPRLLPAPLHTSGLSPTYDSSPTSSLPAITTNTSSSKRIKRYDPYSPTTPSSATGKRSRKKNAQAAQADGSYPEMQTSPPTYAPYSYYQVPPPPGYGVGVPVYPAPAPPAGSSPTAPYSEGSPSRESPGESPTASHPPALPPVPVYQGYEAGPYSYHAYPPPPPPPPHGYAPYPPPPPHHHPHMPPMAWPPPPPPPGAYGYPPPPGAVVEEVEEDA